MGMYTDFMIDCRLKRETPESVLAVLDCLLRRQDIPRGVKAAEYVRYGGDEFTALSSDFRFYQLGDSKTSLVFDKNPEYHLWLTDDLEWALCIGGSIKNYELTLEHFWTWISPWLAHEKHTIIGRSHYEEYYYSGYVTVGQPLKHGTHENVCAVNCNQLHKP